MSEPDTDDIEQEIIQLLQGEQEWTRFEEVHDQFPDLDELELTRVLRSLQQKTKIERGIAKIDGEQVSLYRIDEGYFRYIETDQDNASTE